MAGFYPDPISWRLPYDVDGTQVYLMKTSGAYGFQCDATHIRSGNSEGGVNYMEINGSSGWLVALFPELRDLDGYYFYSYGTGAYAPAFSTAQWSANTTNGYDGDWTSFTFSNSSSSKAAMRDIDAIGALGVRGIRFWQDGSNYAGDVAYRLHLYGERSAGTTGKFLYVWHPTLDQRLTYTTLDYGDVPRTQTTDYTFRVKNDSSFTANNVIVTLEALLEGSPSIAGQFAVSTDGVAFYAQVNIGNLSPGAISQTLTVRQSIASNAELGLFWPRIKAAAGTWT